MVSIENLGDNIVQIKSDMSLWRDTEVMDAEEEVATLEN